MNWMVLILAGIFEVFFTSFLKLSDGFANLKYSILFLLFAAGSFACLNFAIRGIPLGTAYAVWTGIGAFGTAIIGMYYFGEPVSFGRIFFLATLIISIIGLKFVSA